MSTIDVGNVKQNDIGVFTWIQGNLTDDPAFLGTLSPAAITGLTTSIGALNAIYAKDPATGQIRIVDRSRAAPDLGEVTLEERMYKPAINYLERVAKLQCDLAWFIKIGDCGRLDDLAVWDSGLLVEGIQATELDYGAIQSFDADEVVTITGTLNYLQVNRILPIAFSEKAGDAVVAEVVDIISADEISCGFCSPYSDGAQKWYAITKSNSASPGLSGKFVYTEDGWNTTNSLDINGLGGQSPTRLVAAGAYFIIVSEQNGALFYIRKDSLAAGGFTRIATGIQAGGAPSAIFAKSPTEIVVVGLGGYIYRTSNVTVGLTVVHDGTATVQPGNAVHANGQTWVTGHDSNTIMYSINNGRSFTLLTTDAGLNGPEAGANITSVWVLSATQWIVNTNTGKQWFTSNRGRTWTQRQLPNQANLVTVDDMKFSAVSDQVGAMAVRTLSRGYVLRTVDGGRTWYDTLPAIEQIFNNHHVNAVALAGVNVVGVGGLKASSTDGFIAIAANN